MKTTQILLASRPEGEPDDSCFELSTVDLAKPQDGELLLRVVYLSLDPYMRGRMSAAKSYAASVEVGGLLVGATVAEVVESRNERFAVGDIVMSYSGWQSHAVADANAVRRLDRSAGPISTALGVLGMPGFTAYAGLLEIGRPKPGETVVVAAATGPVGSAVGQIAKVKQARAVGIAGGPEKCRALIEEFGFDAAVDHKSPDFVAELDAAVPDGVDVYFDNVGGKVAAAVVRRFNKYGRMPVCGLVSGYNATAAPEGPDQLAAFMGLVLRQSLTVRGFIQDEFVREHYKAFVRDMSGWIADGSVKYREDVVDGLENAPEAFRGLLTGRNFGKMLVRVGEEPAA